MIGRRHYNFETLVLPQTKVKITVLASWNKNFGPKTLVFVTYDSTLWQKYRGPEYCDRDKKIIFYDKEATTYTNIAVCYSE